MTYQEITKMVFEIYMAVNVVLLNARKKEKYFI